MISYYVNNMYIYMFNTTYAKLHIKLSYFFSLNQVLLTALDTFFFGDQAPHPSSGLYCDQPELAP